MHLAFRDVLQVVLELARVSDFAAALHPGSTRLGAEVVIVLRVGLAGPEEAHESIEGALDVLLIH